MRSLQIVMHVSIAVRSAVEMRDVFGLQVRCAVWVRCARCRSIARYGCAVLGLKVHCDARCRCIAMRSAQVHCAVLGLQIVMHVSIAVRSAVEMRGARTAGAMCGMGAMRSLQVHCAVLGLQVRCAVWVRCARCRRIARCRCDARYGCDVLGAGAMRSLQEHCAMFGLQIVMHVSIAVRSAVGARFCGIGCVKVRSFTDTVVYRCAPRPALRCLFRYIVSITTRADSFLLHIRPHSAVSPNTKAPFHPIG